MNSQPVLVMHKICNYLDCDTDYVHLTMSCKKLLASAKKYRKLYATYKFSSISESTHRYNFTNIVYDTTSFVIEMIPTMLETITFDNNFNDDISTIYQLPNLKTIEIGFGFSYIECIKNVPTKIINKGHLTLKTIGNILAKNEYHDDIQRIHADHIVSTYPGYQLKMSINKIYCYLFAKIRALINTPTMYEDASNSILHIIHVRKKIRKNANPSPSQLLLQINDYRKYQCIFDNSFDINRRTKTAVAFVPFMRDNVDLIIEFVKDLEIIFDQMRSYLEYIYDQIVKKYNCQSILEYIELCMNHHK